MIALELPATAFEDILSSDISYIEKFLIIGVLFSSCILPLSWRLQNLRPLTLFLKTKIWDCLHFMKLILKRLRCRILFQEMLKIVLDSSYPIQWHDHLLQNTFLKKCWDKLDIFFLQKTLKSYQQKNLHRSENSKIHILKRMWWWTNNKMKSI